MGFLQAVHSLGVMASRRNDNSSLADIMNYLQLPHPLGEREDRRAYAIRVWLDVTEPESEILEVQGISCIDQVEYQAIGDDEAKIRERCLYRKPVGSNVRWRFSPLYKLGKGSTDPTKELLGKGWQNDTDSRFFKLKQNLLQDYEDSGYFAQDSVTRIMDGLINQLDKIAEYWSDKKRSYLMVFGVNKEGKFLYPGELAAFIKYFREKVNPDTAFTITAVDDSKRMPISSCALCGNQSHKLETLDKVFKFATFDKPGFLPGIKDGAGVREKVYPVCQQCYALLSAGKEEMENRFVNFYMVPGISLYVIPEIISDNQVYYQRTAEFTKDFLEKGIRHEQHLFDNLSSHDEGLVYHFLFAENNQAQLIVHYLIEDVPPTHLKQLQVLWSNTCAVFSRDGEHDSEGKLSLDTALRQIVAVLLSLAGKREQDKMVMRDKAVAVIGALLNGNQVPTTDIKILMVSRFTGLFTDPDWIKPKEKGKMPGRIRLKGMAEVVDFLTRVNGRRKK
ncbi:MAG: TM1802 family CRISPR-associated protein [Bacillota bacterium]